MASMARDPQWCNSGTYILVVTNRNIIERNKACVINEKSFLKLETYKYRWLVTSWILKGNLPFPLPFTSAVPDCILNTSSVGKCRSHTLSKKILLAAAGDSYRKPQLVKIHSNTLWEHAQPQLIRLQKCYYT